MRSRTAILIAALLAGAALRAPGDALVIGPAWSAVAQRFTVAFSNTTQTLEWADLPAEADVSSLHLVAPNSPVNLLAWQRRNGLVHAEVSTDLPRERTFDRICAVTGLSWRASYQLVVRGDLEHEDAPVSVDIDGRMTIRNDSSGCWSNVQVTVVGTSSRPVPVVRESGFLDLAEDSAMAELWLPGTAAAEPLFNYRMDRRVTVRPREERSFTFVSVERRPGERRYRMTSAEVPLETPPPGRPLLRYIAVRNDTAQGLGHDLPPGSAQAFIGTVRAALGEEAWLERTPAGGELRIDFGAASAVLGRRRSLGRKAGTPGQVEETFEIQVVNDQRSVARILIEEQPEAHKDWALVRSTPPCLLRNRKLTYEFELAPRTSQFVRYVIRYPFSPL